MTIVETKCGFCSAITTGEVCETLAARNKCNAWKFTKNLEARALNLPEPFPDLGGRVWVDDDDKIDLDATGGTKQ